MEKNHADIYHVCMEAYGVSKIKYLLYGECCDCLRGM